MSAEIDHRMIVSDGKVVKPIMDDRIMDSGNSKAGRHMNSVKGGSLVPLLD